MSADLTQELTFVQVTMRDHVQWASDPGGSPTSASSSHPIWKVMQRWTVTLVWLPKSGSCCPMQSWTLPARGQRFPPQGGWYSWPWGPPSSQGEDSPKPIATSSQASPQALCLMTMSLWTKLPKGPIPPPKALVQVLASSLKMWFHYKSRWTGPWNAHLWPDHL